MCEHSIGIFCYDDYTELITLEQLKNEIAYYNTHIEYYNKVDELLGIKHAKDRMKRTISDYADRRKNLGLNHFYYCPWCGEKIDWKKIKEENL